MAVQFILGRSGTGKSSYCIEAIAGNLAGPSSSQPLILLVPEQATYQAERAILADKRIAGYNRLNVVSFDRLRFLLSGKTTAKPTLSRTGQQMIIHRILREQKSNLKVLGSAADRPGLSRQMTEVVRELHRYGKTAEDIDQLIGQLDKQRQHNLTAFKFADVGLVLREYLKVIEGRFIDSDLQLAQCCQQVAKAKFAEGARLWVDGFASFTISELAIVVELLKTVADAQIALCLDPSKIDAGNPNAKAIDPASLFYPTEQTYAGLVEIIKKCKLKLAKPIILDKAFRFSGSRELNHIESNLFELKPKKVTASDSIRIISAPNARAEVQFVARQIAQLVKEKNYRYRDIAVIASDIGRYEHYIRAYFEDYGLPFFIDKRKSLNQQPAIGLISSAMQVLAGGFSHSDVFAYLKTGLVPIVCSDIERLENYCVAFGISGEDWQSDKEWSFAKQEEYPKSDEQDINQIRLKVTGPLFALRDKLCPRQEPEKTVGPGEFAAAVFDLLDSLHVTETINTWVEQAIESGDYAAADEHRQCYDKLVGVFDELVEAFADQTMKWCDLAAVINSAFSQITLAFIPPTLDQILVGSIERSRHPNLKAVFLIGATQKQFPTKISYDDLLTHNDRTAAETVDFALSPAAEGALVERQYLAYIAFTRASQLLCITYPLADDNGGALVRSQFVANLESLFKNVSEESTTDLQIDLEKVGTERELADCLCSQLGKDAAGFVKEDKEQVAALLAGICADAELGQLGTAVRSAVDYDNSAQLQAKIVSKLFEKQMRSSATKLSTYAACPFRHFARYILGLEERKEFKLRPLDLGEFYHCVLDTLQRQLNAEDKNFATVPDDELLSILRNKTAEIIQEDSFISNFVHRSMHNRFIINCACEILEDCVLAIAQMISAGQFTPALSEVWFGGTDDVLGAYCIPLPNGRFLALRGRIDRLDIAEMNGEKVAIVFDYKRTGKSFSWSKFFHGLDLQLPIYLLAVENSTRLKITKAAGAFYMPVEISPQQATLDQLPEKATKFNRKAKGLFSGNFAEKLDKKASKYSNFYNFYVTRDGSAYGNYGTSGALKPSDFSQVLQFTEEKIVELAEDILSGKIDVKPYRLGTEVPCTYCQYKSVCRFDWQINDYNSLESVSKLAVLERIGAVND